MAAIDGCSREDGVVEHRDRCTRRPEPAGKSTRQHPGEHRDGWRHERREQPPARKPASILGVGDAASQPRLLRPEDRRGLARRRLLTPLVPPAVAVLARVLPRRLPRWLRSTGATVAMLHYAVLQSHV